MEICRKLISVSACPGGAVAQLDHAVMHVYFMTERIVRLKVCFEESTVERSG